MTYTPEIFNQMLMMAVKNGVSDIHLRTGEKPHFRVRGNLKPIKANTISEEDMLLFCKIMIKDEKVLQNLKTVTEYDGSYQYKNLCRVRVNLLKFQGRFAFILRVVNMQIPTIKELGLPNGCKEISKAKRGLVLITGVTGSGKSSTLAAMIEEINTNREEHILTIEDPVEFLFHSKKCRITQREMGSDTMSFKEALRGALRQDPDVIVIGELRDAETIQIAMKAAETGHLVFGTVHTTNALTTINRIVSMFPPEEQNNVKGRLSDCLQATVSQRLLPTADGKGRVVAQEIMVTSPGIREALSGKVPLSEIYIFIEKAKRDGVMQSFDQHLTDLYKKGTLSFDVARDAATSPSNFERNLQFGSSGEDESDSAKKTTPHKDPNIQPEEDLELEI